jgi:hypothetical protein
MATTTICIKLLPAAGVKVISPDYVEIEKYPISRSIENMLNDKKKMNKHIWRIIWWPFLHKLQL